MAIAAVLGLTYLTWHASPAWLFTAAIIASTFNSNWDAFGLPSGFAPDRLILVAAILALLLPSAGARARPPLEFQPVHLLWGLALVWALGSAIAAGTLTESMTV
jgi:hypothetical protein